MEAAQISIALEQSHTRTLVLADGRRIHCRMSAGIGEPIVLLHGLLDSSEGWAEFIASQHRPCIAFDLPGFGRSDLPARPQLSAYAEDIREALDLLDAPMMSFALVGHSLGGAVAAALADVIGDRVSALLLIAPAGFGRIPLAEAVSLPGVRQLSALALPIALKRKTVLTIAYRGFVTNNHAPEPGTLTRVIDAEADLVTAARLATEAIVTAGQSERAFHRRRLAYDGPVVAIWGTSDRVVPPRHSAGVCTAFPQAEIVTWRGMGHHPQRERFDDLLDVAARVCSGAPGLPARTVGQASQLPYPAQPLAPACLAAA